MATDEEWRLQVRVISAQSLKDVSFFGKMRTYVSVYINPASKMTTHVEKKGGRNPTWNHRLNLTVSEHMLRQPNASLMMEIMSRSALRDQPVGYVRVPFAEILASPNVKNEYVPMCYQVRRPSGRFKGILNIQVRMSERSCTTPWTPRNIEIPSQLALETSESSPPPEEDRLCYSQPSTPQQQDYQSAFASSGQQPARFSRLSSGVTALGIGMGLNSGTGGAMTGLLMSDLLSDISFDAAGGYTGDDSFDFMGGGGDN